jgi:hypothetical protein
MAGLRSSAAGSRLEVYFLHAFALKRSSPRAERRHSTCAGRPPRGEALRTDPPKPIPSADTRYFRPATSGKSCTSRRSRTLRDLRELRTKINGEAQQRAWQ